MLKNKAITFYVKRHAMLNVYIETSEHLDLIDNLTPNEQRLYSIVKGMAVINQDATSLSNKALAKKLGVSLNTLGNVKNSLKKKGYLIIRTDRDADGDLRASVFIGKDQVELYNLGLKYEITDAKVYRELANMFHFDDPNICTTLEERKEAVERANDYYRQNYK